MALKGRLEPLALTRKTGLQALALTYRVVRLRKKNRVKQLRPFTLWFRRIAHGLQITIYLNACFFVFFNCIKYTI